ncbi:MAG: hypothetical protein HYY05_03455, partial [Chloroflexi bacterium]|nr:hypothetical protein [Chloroflexota bacterium]
MRSDRPRRRPNPRAQWEQEVVDAYHDKCWRDLLEPLYDRFQAWKAGQLTHADVDETIHQTHRASQKLFTFFAQSRSYLVRLVQFSAEAWFREWVSEHPAPQQEAPQATVTDRPSNPRQA